MKAKYNQVDSSSSTKPDYDFMRKIESLQFWIGNPTIELISGNLYFEMEDVIEKAKTNNIILNVNQMMGQIEMKKRIIGSSLLAIISIPNSRHPTEICEIVKEFEHHIEIMRILKTTLSKYYTIVIKFLNESSSQAFYTKYHQARFNLLEEDLCIIRVVSKVGIKKEKLNDIHTNNNNNNNNIEESLEISENSEHYVTAEEFFMINHQSLRWTKTENDNQTNCPICLERLVIHENTQINWIFEEQKSLDNVNNANKASIEINNQNDFINEFTNKNLNESNQILQIPTHSPRLRGIQSEKFDHSPVLGILCGHFFHLRCLEKWNDSICPICRYHQHPPESSLCEICHNSDDLWMCIVCGFIGCTTSHYPGEGHIREHYENTKHTYAVEVETKCVFDYAKNGFVHRLLQNAVDGKIIQHSLNGEKQQQYGDIEKKIENIAQEYHSLMASQSESQRNYYQEILNKLSKEQEMSHYAQKKQIEKEQKDLEKLKQHYEEVKSVYDDKRAIFLKYKEEFQRLNQEKKDLENLNKNLVKEQEKFKKEADNRKSHELDELKSIKEEILSISLEIHDIETHLATNAKLNKALKKEGEEIGFAHIFMSKKQNKKRKK